MQPFSSITLEKETKLENARFHTQFGPLALLKNGDLIVSYQDSGESGVNPRGRLSRIKDNQVIDFFKTRMPLHHPVLDEEENVYVTTEGTTYVSNAGNTNDPTTLYKFHPRDELIWDYHVAGLVTEPPVIHKELVFVVDFVHPGLTSHLHCLNRKTGNLIWRKDYEGPLWAAPFFLADRDEFLLGIRRTGDLLVLDLEGNVRQTIKGIKPWAAGDIFSEGKGGVIYANMRPLTAFGGNLETLWSYVPSQTPGSVSSAPVIDSENNLYFRLNDNRLASVDADGHERWIVRTAGSSGLRPMVLKSGQILMITDASKPKLKRGEEDSLTYLEIFSHQGEKIAEATMVGNVWRAINVDHQVFVATLSTIGIPYGSSHTRHP